MTARGRTQGHFSPHRAPNITTISRDLFAVHLLFGRQRERAHPVNSARASHPIITVHASQGRRRKVALLICALAFRAPAGGAPRQQRLTWTSAPQAPREHRAATVAVIVPLTIALPLPRGAGHRSKRSKCSCSVRARAASRQVSAERLRYPARRQTGPAGDPHLTPVRAGTRTPRCPTAHHRSIRRGA